MTNISNVFEDEQMNNVSNVFEDEGMSRSTDNVNQDEMYSYTRDQILQDLLDFGQMALYSDLKPKYATSQLIKDALSPFRETYNFTTQISGYVIVPDSTYLDLLDIQIYFQVSLS